VALHGFSMNLWTISCKLEIRGAILRNMPLPLWTPLTVCEFSCPIHCCWSCLKDEWERNCITLVLYHYYCVRLLCKYGAAQTMRTTHMRIIRAYFAYTHMCIRVHTCVYVSWLCFPTSFFTPQHCLTNKRHFWNEKAWGFNMKFALFEKCQWKLKYLEFRLLHKFTDKLPFINNCLIFSCQKVSRKIETVAWFSFINNIVFIYLMSHVWCLLGSFFIIIIIFIHLSTILTILTLFTAIIS